MTTDTRALAVVKAEEMARAGALSERDRARIERRYSVRLPVPERRHTPSDDMASWDDDALPERRRNQPLDPDAYRA